MKKVIGTGVGVSKYSTKYSGRDQIVKEVGTA